MQRRWANISLLVLLALLLVALVFHRASWSPYLLGTALAGLAGAIADWYAVTALFRHPLGFRWLPHTSIISANRDRIIDAISTLVETELLSTDFLNANIQRISFTEVLMGWLGQPLSEDVQKFFATTGAAWLNAVDVEPMAIFLEREVARRAEDLTVADWGVRLIEWLIQSGHDKALFLFLSEQVETALDQVELTDDLERRIREMLEQYTKTGTQKFFLGLLESLGTVDYHELTLSIKAALKRWLRSDSAFEQFDLVLVRIMRALRDDAIVRARVEEAKMGLLGQVPWDKVVLWLKTELVRALQEGQVTSGLSSIMTSLRGWLDHEPGIQAQFDALVRGVIMRAVTEHHSVIGRLVRDNLRAMDERDWIDKLEYYVGRDLQWIRVNGAIVGALVGLVITVATHL